MTDERRPHFQKEQDMNLEMVPSVLKYLHVIPYQSKG
jgi:hypothetical protein